MTSLPCYSAQEYVTAARKRRRDKTRVEKEQRAALYALVSRPGALRASDAPTKRARRGANAGNREQGSNWIRREKRIAIYERDGWRCVWCCCEVGDSRMLAELAGVAGQHHVRLATLDHFLARSRGGTNRADNLLTCCMQCNHDRSHMSALDWATLIGGVANRPAILERALQALDRPIAKAPKA